MQASSNSNCSADRCIPRGWPPWLAASRLTASGPSVTTQVALRKWRSSTLRRRNFHKINRCRSFRAQNPYQTNLWKWHRLWLCPCVKFYWGQSTHINWHNSSILLQPVQNDDKNKEKGKEKSKEQGNKKADHICFRYREPWGAAPHRCPGRCRQHHRSHRQGLCHWVRCGLAKKTIFVFFGNKPHQ